MRLKALAKLDTDTGRMRRASCRRWRMPDCSASAFPGSAAGGSGGDVADAVEAIAAVSALRSLAAGFVFWGQRTFIEYLLAEPERAALREKLLPDLIAGRTSGRDGTCPTR
jgi:hypothetical protein